MTDVSTPALDALRRQVREQLALLSYPGRDWVRPVVHPGGLPVHDVVIVGAGQAGLGTALALRRDGVANVLVIKPDLKWSVAEVTLGNKGLKVMAGDMVVSRID